MIRAMRSGWLIVTSLHVRLHCHGCIPLPGKMHDLLTQERFWELNLFFTEFCSFHLDLYFSRDGCEGMMWRFADVYPLL
jgi:hypothetical protein